MPVSAKNVLTRCQVILQDAGAVRWPLTELVDWLNDGLKQIRMLKPNATAETSVIPLEVGTMQSVPPEYAILIRAWNNCASDGTPEGNAITPIVREILDQQKPGWHDGTVVPFRRRVRHVASDISDPRVFFVYPGNDGTGHMRATLSRIPDEITPVTGADPEDMDAYDVDIAGLQAIYQQCLVDYVLAMAFSKDMQYAGSAERAAVHMAQFTTALGTRQAVEAVANINTTNTQPNS